MQVVLKHWCGLGFCWVGAMFVPLFLIIRIMQQPIPMPLHFRGHLGGCLWCKPSGYWIGMLIVLPECLFHAMFDDLCSGGNPTCQFCGGCFIEQCGQISGKHAAISGKTFGFQVQKFGNDVFLLIEWFQFLFCVGFPMDLFISGLPQVDDLLKNGCHQFCCPIRRL